MSPNSPFVKSLERWSENRDVMRFVHWVLDKRDRRGCFPKTATYHGTDLDMRAIDRFLPPVCLRRKSGDRLVINLQKVQELIAAEARDAGHEPPNLEAIFDALTGRTRHDFRHENAQWEGTVSSRIAEGIEEGRQRAARAGARGVDALLDHLVARLTDQDDPEHRRMRKLVRESSMRHMRESVARLVAGFLLVRTPRAGTLRLDHVSLAVAGDTKALRPDTQDYDRLVRALFDADTQLRQTLAPHQKVSNKISGRFLLEHHGIVPNEAPFDVLVRGPLTLVGPDGEPLGDVGRLARQGLPSKLTYGILRACEPTVPAGTEIVCVENESAFHTLAHDRPDRLYVYTAGQPTWAVVLLVKKLTVSSPGVCFFHAGDLDRSGLLILRSLREKTGIAIQPCWMDAETYEACLDLSLATSKGEQDLTQRLVETWNEPYGQDLLHAMVKHKRWIEQEAVLQRVLNA